MADLRDLGGELIAFYGQHEHRKLTLASAQLEILDDVCGPAQREHRARFAERLGTVRELEASLADLRERAGTRDRELDLLEFELAEIEEVAPREDEEAELLAERERLRHLEGLRAAAAWAPRRWSRTRARRGATALLAAGRRRGGGARGVDAALDELAERLRAVRFEAEDLGAELRGYGQEIDASPGRLDEVEERLAALERLKRKHGGTVAAVLEHARALPGAPGRAARAPKSRWRRRPASSRRRARSWMPRPRR